jgi:nucleotide-binding universal stress UspA family protein
MLIYLAWSGVNLYKRILVALDGSGCANLARDIGKYIAKSGDGTNLIGCHAYAASLHRARFEDMEPILPKSYDGEGLKSLRKTHEGLIGSSMQLIFNSYLELLAKGTLDKDIAYESVPLEGRNYVQILKAAGEKVADLLAMGTSGQGHAEGLGSTAERFLTFSQGGDVLLMRRPWSFEGGTSSWVSTAAITAMLPCDEL